MATDPATTQAVRASGEKRALRSKRAPWWGPALIALVVGGGGGAGGMLARERAPDSPAKLEYQVGDHERRLAKQEAASEDLRNAVEAMKTSTALMQASAASMAKSVEQLAGDVRRIERRDRRDER